MDRVMRENTRFCERRTWWVLTTVKVDAIDKFRFTGEGEDGRELIERKGEGDMWDWHVTPTYIIHLL